MSHDALPSCDTVNKASPSFPNADHTNARLFVKRTQAARHKCTVGYLSALDKQPGVCMVSVGETWRRLFSKCVLKFTVPEATNVYQYYHICSKLRTGIDRAVHDVKYIWDVNSSIENWGFLLVYAKKLFN